MDSPLGGAVPIAAVERDTGLSKDTLRIWERRYGFPQPQRDAQGERAYPPEQVDKLRLVKRLMDAGHRPGKLIGLDVAALRALGPAERAPDGGRLPEPWLALLKAHDVAGLRRHLQQALIAQGVERFVMELVAPMNLAVGEAWMRGELSVTQEHVYTEAVQLVLRQAIGTLPEPERPGPRVLMATLPHEGHGLGLLMAEAMLSVHGWRCVSLGLRVPVDDLVTAARMVQAHIVALSFSGSSRPQQVTADLQELRRRLPEGTRIWAGGSNLALQRRLPEGVEPVTDIALVPALVQRWCRAGVASGN